MVGGAVSALLGLVVGGSGCSYAFVEGPPPPTERAGLLHCTSNMWAPVVDSAVTGLQGVRVLLAAGASDRDYDMATLSRNWDLGIGVALLTAFGSSALFGYMRTSECRAAKDEQRTELARQTSATQLYARRRAEASTLAERLAAAPALRDRWPEDDAIARAYGGKVVRSCWLNPAPEAAAIDACVRRGDFDGDGRPDVAVLVVEAAEPRRKGIALLTSDAERSLLGAGNAVGNGGADFSWMDAWRVSKKAETTRLIGRAAGDGLIVEKAESASGLIGIVAGRPQWAQWSD